MAEITAAAVNELRKRTTLPMMECKKALVEANGDMEEAVKLLKIRNKNAMDKRVGNETGEGRVFVAVDGSTAAIVEMLCESAPVAKSEQFIELGNAVAKQYLAGAATDAAALLLDASPARPGQTLGDHLGEVVGLIREKMQIGRMTRLTGGSFGHYVHHDGSLGVLVQATPEGGDPVVLKDVAMHAAAAVPVPAAARREDVPAEIVAREMEIARAKAEATGKTGQIVDHIAQGQMKTWYGENVLGEQPFVKDPSKSVAQVLEAARLQLVAFVRYKIGQA